MNKLGQLGIILGILFLGELLQIKFNLPIPATILGMIILLTLMVLKIIKLKWVDGIGNILLDNLSIMFVPAGINIMKELDLFKGQILSLITIIAISTIIVMLVTGYTVQVLENNRRSKGI